MINIINNKEKDNYQKKIIHNLISTTPIIDIEINEIDVNSKTRCCQPNISHHVCLLSLLLT